MQSDTAPHLNERQLAARWQVSPRTLQRWRTARLGPAWMKINGRILYALADVRTFEATGRHPGGSLT